MERKKKNKKRKYLIGGVVAVVVIIGVAWAFSGSGQGSVDTVKVERGDVESIVSVTGQVVPSKNIDLAFEKSGRVERIRVEVGDEAYAGEVLAQLDTSELAAQVAQARANLRIQEVKLKELEEGTRAEEIAVKRAELEKAKQDLENYYKGIVSILNDAYGKADDAVRTKTDEMFLNDDSTTPRLTFTVTDSQIETDVISKRVSSGLILKDWRESLKNLDQNDAREDLAGALDKGKENLENIRDFMATALDATNNYAGVSADTIASYKASIYTGRSNVNTSYTSLSAQEQNIASQEVLVERTDRELDLKLAGNTPEQISAQEAQVEQARANLRYYESQLAKLYVRSPFEGTVTKVVVDPGEIVSANDPVVTLIGSGTFEIESFIAESDIAKVEVGDTATVTLDAYGRGEVFTAQVTHIDLSETLLEGVATYKTRLSFDTEDERILPGLTADVDILHDRKEAVLYLPTRNIAVEGERRFVTVLTESGETLERDIETGLRGSDGRTEIISGLQQGDRVVAE